MPVKPFLLLLGAGILLLFIGADLGEDSLQWLGMLLVGAAAMILYRPALMHGMLPARLPGPAELATMLLFGAAGLGGGYALDLLTAVPAAGMSAAGERLRALGLAAAFLAPALPMAAQIARNARTPGRNPPLWPALTGIAAGTVAAVMVAGVLPMFLAAMLKLPKLTPDLLGAPAVMAAAGLLAAVCGETWRRALLAGDAPRLAGPGVFGIGIVGALIGLMLGLLACVAVLLAARGGMRHPVDGGIVAGAALVLVAGAAWLPTLISLRGSEPASPGTGVVAVALLVVAFLLTLIPPAMIGGSREMAGIALFVMVPVTAVAVVAAARWVPALVRRVLGAQPGPAVPR